MGELVDDLRHHGDQQNGDHRDRHHRQGNGVDHRLGELAFHLLALLVVLGELFQHATEMTGLFTGHHQGAVELVEAARKLAEGVEQRVTFHNLVADLGHHRRQGFIFRLLRNRLQRTLQRQRGIDQRRELSGKHRQHRNRQLCPFTGVFSRRRIAGRRNVHWHQLLFAQHLAHLLWPFGLQGAALGFPRGVRRGPRIPGHYASPPRSAVTRITSSSEVTPEITFSRPFSRRL